MAHNIEEYDKGVVMGETWHGLPQYIQQEGPVTYEQAYEVMDYPLLKTPNYRKDHSGEIVAANSWSIIRTDHDIELAGGVGKQFAVLPNTRLLDFVHQHLMKQYPDLYFESVGTLENGATSFVNITTNRRNIRGDESDIVDRLMYYNPLGRGAYQACAHSVRIVCNNTLQQAALQGVANNTLLKIRHTSSAEAVINEHLIDLADYYFGLEKTQEAMQELADMPMTVEQADKFLAVLFPYSREDASARAKSMANNKRDAVKENFETCTSLDSQTKSSRYGMLQAVTYFFDHLPLTENRDEMSIVWSGLIGQSAKHKNRAFKLLREGRF